MKVLVTILSIVAFIVVSTNSLGQITLLEAKEYALKNHFDIVNADLEYNKALFKKKEYLSAGMPEAFIKGGFNQFPNLVVILNETIVMNHTPIVLMKWDVLTVIEGVIKPQIVNHVFLAFIAWENIHSAKIVTRE